MDTLLVDDSAVTRVHLTRLLTARGHTVTALEDAESAWVQCQVRRFALMILDWHLPGMDGLALCRRIREVPGGDGGVILFLTSRDDPRSLADALRAGADDYLPKSSGTAALDIRLAVAEQQVAERARRFQAEADLRAERDMLQQLMDSMPDLIYFKDRQSRFTRINRALTRTLGLAMPDEAIGMSDFDFHPGADAAQYFAYEQGMMASGTPLVNHFEDVSGRAGRECWLLSTKVPLVAQGDVVGMVGISRDVTAQRQAETALRESEARFRQLIELAPVGAFILDDQGRFETVNPAYAAMLGYTVAELLGQHFSLVLPSWSRNQEQGRIAWSIDRARESQEEYAAMDKHGQMLTLLSSSLPLTEGDGRKKRAYFVVDISERKRTEQRLAELAHFDRLTGLPNRALFVQRLDEELARAEQHTSALALLFIDLDGFKEVNDSYGHGMGDLLLQVVAQRLAECVRETDLVARLAGDEFTAILPTIRDSATADKIAGKMLMSLSQPFNLRDHVVRVSASIGIALFPEHGRERERLLTAADAAMYMAKGAGRSCFALYTA